MKKMLEGAILVGGAVVALLMFLAALTIIGEAIETQARMSEELDRCLKQATNGYETRQCERGAPR